MRPEEYIQYRNETLDEIRRLRNTFTRFMKTAKEYKPKILRPMTKDDIKVGAVIWYRSAAGGSEFNWYEILEVFEDGETKVGALFLTDIGYVNDLTKWFVEQR